MHGNREQIRLATHPTILLNVQFKSDTDDFSW